MNPFVKALEDVADLIDAHGDDLGIPRHMINDFATRCDLLCDMIERSNISLFARFVNSTTFWKGVASRIDHDEEDGDDIYLTSSQLANEIMTISEPDFDLMLQEIVGGST